MTHENAHQVSQNLACDGGHGELPSPKAPSKPTSASSTQTGAKHQKKNTHCSSKRRELLVRGRVHRPHLIEKGALPNQCRSRQKGHDGAKEQEHANGRHCPSRPSSHPGLCP